MYLYVFEFGETEKSEYPPLKNSRNEKQIFILCNMCRFIHKWTNPFLHIYSFQHIEVESFRKTM